MEHVANAVESEDHRDSRTRWHTTCALETFNAENYVLEVGICVKISFINQIKTSLNTHADMVPKIELGIAPGVFGGKSIRTYLC